MVQYLSIKAFMVLLFAVQFWCNVVQHTQDFFEAKISNNSAINITLEIKDENQFKRPFVFCVPGYYKPIKEFNKIVDHADGKQYRIRQLNSSNVELDFFNVSETSLRRVYYFVDSAYEAYVVDCDLKKIIYHDDVHFHLMRFVLSVSREVRFNDVEIVRGTTLVKPNFEVPNYIAAIVKESETSSSCTFRHCSMSFYLDRCEKSSNDLEEKIYLDYKFTNRNGTSKLEIEDNLHVLFNGELMCLLMPLCCSDGIRGTDFFYRTIKVYIDAIYDVLRITELESAKNPEKYQSLSAHSNQITCCLTYHSGFTKVKWMPLNAYNIASEKIKRNYDIIRADNNFENQTVLKVTNCMNDFEVEKEFINYRTYFTCITVKDSEFVLKNIEIYRAERKCYFGYKSQSTASFESVTNKFGHQIILNTSKNIDFDCDYEGFPKLPASWQNIRGELRKL